MISFLFMSDLNTDLCFSLSDPILCSIPKRDFAEIPLTIFARYIFSTPDLTDYSGMGYMTLLRASAMILMWSSGNVFLRVPITSDIRDHISSRWPISYTPFTAAISLILVNFPSTIFQIYLETLYLFRWSRSQTIDTSYSYRFPCVYVVILESPFI